MKKWIRWGGFIAFIVITALMTVFWLFLVDGVVRRVVERTGTAIVGAEVDVAGARLGLSPLGITLSGIQVTDPENPSANSVEIGRVAFSLDGLNLLRRKVIIQEMSAEHSSQRPCRSLEADGKFSAPLLVRLQLRRSAVERVLVGAQKVSHRLLTNS